MTLIKKTNFPLFQNEKWMTNFFDADRFFDSDWMKSLTMPNLPAVNIVENEKEFLVELAAPGMAKKDFQIAVENGVLTVSAQKEADQTEDKKNYTRREYNFTQFSRSFSLPENVADEKIKAYYSDGILKLHVAKKETAKVQAKREIAVN